MTIRLLRGQHTSRPDIGGMVFYNEPITVTGVTAHFAAYDAQGVKVIDGVVTISDIVEGPNSWSFRWLYDLQDADTATAGTLCCQLEITWAGGEKEKIKYFGDSLDALQPLHLVIEADGCAG